MNKESRHLSLIQCTMRVSIDALNDAAIVVGDIANYWQLSQLQTIVIILYYAKWQQNIIY